MHALLIWIIMITGMYFIIAAPVPLSTKNWALNRVLHLWQTMNLDIGSLKINQRVDIFLISATLDFFTYHT